MPIINFEALDGEKYSINAEPDYSIMEVAYNNDVPGIIAECGGGAACGTCHVYIDQEFQHLFSPISDVEDAMLYMVEERNDNSRLSCQLPVTEMMEGLVVKIADNII